LLNAVIKAIQSGGITDIGVDGQNFLVQLLDFRNDRARRLGVDVAGGDPDAGLGQSERHRTPDPTRAADDHGDLPRKTRVCLEQSHMSFPH